MKGVLRYVEIGIRRDVKKSLDLTGAIISAYFLSFLLLTILQGVPTSFR